MGELIQVEQEAGRLRAPGGNGSNQHAANITVDDITSLSDLGIPRDRSARAQKLAEVPEKEFEAALQEPRKKYALARLSDTSETCPGVTSSCRYLGAIASHVTT